MNDEMDDDASILKEFLMESNEGVGRLDQEFVSLEKEPTDTSLIGSIFRTFHTIKGTCGFLGLPRLENISHGAENILSAIRDNTIPVTEDGITILLDAVDVIKEILEHIEAGGKEPNKSYDDMRQSLDAYLAEALSTEQNDSPSSKSGLSSEKHEKEDAKQKSEKKKSAKDLSAKSNSPLKNEVKAPLEKSQGAGLSLADTTIRVDVGLLDKLIDMVGELVLARNQLLQQVRGGDENGALSGTCNGTIQQVNLITTELQDTVMKTRMQPIKNVWDKFPRVLRDLARSNGKEIEIVMEGAETELDKTLIEAIKDPMTHIVRNAADHGIELPDLREERGKSPAGTLFLKACHEGGQISIEVSDDGAGIDVEVVKQKAIDKGLISVEAAAQMSDRESLNLIFEAGLSTAKKITNVSGRGVGMDVVKTNIEKIGGTIDLSSRLGKGTHMRIKIPLTLAIIPALMVRSGGEPFAIPQASLLELVRIDTGSEHQIEEIQGSDFYRLRGRLLPLISLNKVLKLGKFTVDMGNGTVDKGTNIVILKTGECSFGLIVDMVNDSEEIVVKPLSRLLKRLSYLAGATIMGNGRVALIIDVRGIAQEGGLLGGETSEVKKMSEEEKEEKQDKATMILFSVGENGQYAIPLSQVARLEDFEAATVEQSAGFDVVQYRGELLPLVHLGDTIGVGRNMENSEQLPAIVFSKNGKSIGLVVDKIIDIIAVEMALHASPSGKAGVEGSMVINGVTTDILDVDRIIDAAVPGWFEGVPV